MTITEITELIGHLRQQTFPIALGGKTAVVVAATEFFELVVQVYHGVLVLW